MATTTASRTFAHAASPGGHTVAREWRSAAVRALAPGDLAAIETVLRAHAAASACEQRERILQGRLGQPWSLVVAEAGASRAASIEHLGPVLAGAGHLWLRTFARTASVTFGPDGFIVRVDDDHELAAATIRAIRRIARRRRQPLAALMLAEWPVPAMVLGAPVLASAFDPAGHAGALAWEGMAFAVCLLVAWLWWRFGRWPSRALVIAPPVPVLSRSCASESPVPGGTR
ncbi:MAG: hypothetical protein ACKOWF_16665 [Chloroflexota bacterium]